MKTYKIKRNSQDASWTCIYTTIKYSAKRRNINFNLSFDDFKSIVNQECFYKFLNCQKLRKYSVYNRGGKDKPVSLASKTVSLKRIEDSIILISGIDRVNNDIGYVKENCKPCCPNCNYLKMDNSILNIVKNAEIILNNKNKLLTAYKDTLYIKE